MSTVPDLGREFQRRLTRLGETVSRIDQTLASGAVRQADVGHVYEATFVAAVAEFEATLEEILIEAVCGRRPLRRGRYPLLAPKSRGSFRAIVLQGRQYVEMIPFGRALDLAAMYLKDGKPFSEVTNVDRQTIAEALLIRNAIAHRSRSALDKFKGGVPGVDRLPANQRRPAAYLRRQVRVGQTRHSAYLAGLGSAVGSIIAGWT